MKNRIVYALWYEKVTRDTLRRYGLMDLFFLIATRRADQTPRPSFSRVARQRLPVSVIVTSQEKSELSSPNKQHFHRVV